MRTWFLFYLQFKCASGVAFGGTWEDPGGCFFKFAVKRALKQDQIVHMEGKLQFILYFSREWLYLVDHLFDHGFFSLHWDEWLLCSHNYRVDWRKKIQKNVAFLLIYWLDYRSDFLLLKNLRRGKKQVEVHSMHNFMEFLHQQ